MNSHLNEPKGDLDSWKSYISFGLSYAINTFIETLWIRLDIVATSILYNNHYFAAQIVVLNIASLIDCFCYGFGVAITSKISKAMVLQDVKKAKLISVIVLLQG